MSMDPRYISADNQCYLNVKGLTEWIDGLRNIGGLYLRDVDTGKCYLVRPIDEPEPEDKQGDPDNYCGAV